MVFYDGFDWVLYVVDGVRDLVDEGESGVGEGFVAAWISAGKVSEVFCYGFDGVGGYERSILVVVGEFDGLTVVIVVEAGWDGNV